MVDEPVHEGGCLCGDIRYAVSGAPVRVCVCYCESCTRASGGIVVAWSGFAAARFKLSKGRLTLFESTPGITRGFCPRCGTSLTYQKNPTIIAGARDDVYVTTRTLDRPDAYPPDEHVYYGERLPWLAVADGRPHYDGASANPVRPHVREVSEDR